jgi:hypothetical protein
MNTRELVDILPKIQPGIKSQITKKPIILLIVSLATLAVMAGCTASSTPTQSPQNQQPIEVISVLEPPQDPNPGGGIIEITLKNVGVEPVIALAAILTIRGPFNYDFAVSPSHSLLLDQSISAQQRLIGSNDGWGTGIAYSVTINGTLQSGATFAYTWQPPNQ